MNKKTLIVLIVLIAALKIGLALAIPLTADESLHWMQSRHLALGFRDHPPGTASLDLVGRMLFGVSIIGIRFFSILSTTACSLIAFAILKETGYSEESAGAGAISLQIMPMFAFGIIMVPVFPFAALIFAAEYFFIRALRSGRMMDHLLWGFFLGISMMTYYIAATAVLAAAVFCLVGRRDVFRRGPFWAGAVLAAVVFAPNVWWNIVQGTDSAICFQILQRSPYNFNIQYALSYAIISVVIAGPLVLPALVLGVRNLLDRSFSRKSWPAFFAIFVTVPFLAFLLLSFFREAGAHWAVVSFLNVPLLLASGESQPSRITGKWFKAGAIYSAAIAATALILLSIGTERCATSIDPKGNLASRRKIHLFFGAESAGQAARKLKESLSQQGLDTTFATDKWGYAGILSFYTPGHPYYFVVPSPSRHGQDYTLWNLKHPSSPNAIFLTGRSTLRQSVKDACANARLLDEENVEIPADYGFYLCTGFRPTGK